MAETQETIADIIAEMHRFAKQHEYDHPDMDTNACGIEDYADRLEAAYEREKAAIEADALAVGGVVEAAHRRELAERGDAAKLREALLSIKELNFEHEEDWYDFYRIIETALAAPPRNCESLDAPKDCNDKAIHVSDRVHMLNTDSSGDHEWDDEVCSLEFVGEGGGDTWLVHGREGAAWACECEVLKQEGATDAD